MSGWRAQKNPAQGRVFGFPGSGDRIARFLQPRFECVSNIATANSRFAVRGMKQSGIGREGSQDGIHEFLEKKYIAVEW